VRALQNGRKGRKRETATAVRCGGRGNRATPVAMMEEGELPELGPFPTGATINTILASEAAFDFGDLVGKR